MAITSPCRGFPTAETARNASASPTGQRRRHPACSVPVSATGSSAFSGHPESFAGLEKPWSRLPHHGLGPPGGSFPWRKNQANSLGSRRNAGAHHAGLPVLRGFAPKERKENEGDREILPQVLPQLKTRQWSSKKPLARKGNQTRCPIQCPLTTLDPSCVQTNGILGPSCSSLKPLFQSDGGVTRCSWRCVPPLGSRRTGI